MYVGSCMKPCIPSLCLVCGDEALALEWRVVEYNSKVISHGYTDKSLYCSFCFTNNFSYPILTLAASRKNLVNSHHDAHFELTDYTQ